MYDREAHMAAIAKEADAAYWRVRATDGAEEAYYARRRVYGYTYPGTNYSRVAQPLRCDRPMVAPLTEGSVIVDVRMPGSTFVIARVESHFGDSMLLDASGRWHEIEDVRVVEYVSPEDLAQRKQDRILARLERAYDLAH